MNSQLKVKQDDYYIPVNVKTYARDVKGTFEYLQGVDKVSVDKALDAIDVLRPVAWNKTYQWPSDAYFDVQDMVVCDGTIYAVGGYGVGVTYTGALYRSVDGDPFEKIASNPSYDTQFSMSSVTLGDGDDIMCIAVADEISYAYICGEEGTLTRVRFDSDTDTSYVHSHITYGNGTYVIAPYAKVTTDEPWEGACDSVFVSTNGTSWTKVTLPSAQYMGAIHYANGKFIIACVWNDFWFSSADGITWTEIPLPPESPYNPYTFEKEWTSLTYGNGVWVAIAHDDFQYICTACSEDNGVTWTLGSMPYIGYWRDICFDGKKFIAVMELEEWAYTNKLAVSMDGKRWVGMPMNTYGTWRAIDYDDLNDEVVVARGNMTLNCLAERHSTVCYNDYYSRIMSG